MENVKNKNGFLVTCVSCILLLLVMCYFGVNTSTKGTSAAMTSDQCTALGGNWTKGTTVSGYWCCPDGYSAGVMQDAKSGEYYCMNYVDDLPDGIYRTATDGGYICESNIDIPGPVDEEYANNQACSAKLGSSWESVSCVATALDGYGKGKWNCDCTASSLDSCGGAKPLTITSKKVELTFDGNGGIVDYLQDMNDPEESAISIPQKESVSVNCSYVPELETGCELSYYASAQWEGYKFLGWSTDSKCNSNIIKNDVTVNSTATYYACWEAKRCYCWDTEDGETCKMLSVSEAGSYIAVDDSKCSSGDSSSGDTATTYTIKLIGKGGTVNGSSTYDLTVNTGAKVTLPEAVKSGDTFKGWSTTTDSTVEYAKGSQYTFSKDMTLYAVWETNQTSTTYTITLVATGGTVMGVAEFDLKVNAGQTTTIPSASKSGSRFKGWATSAGSTNVVYSASTQYTFTKDMTLFAVWETDYTIIYNSNGGSGTMSKQTCVAGKCTLNKNTLSRSGYTFIGWDTKADGTGVSYQDASTVTIKSDLVLFAQWVSNSSGGTTSKTFKATFNANNGTLNGNSSDTCTTTASSCQVANLPTASRSGYTFKGWGTSSSCTSGSTSYLTLSANTTYYACWVSNSSGGGTTTAPGNVIVKYKVSADGNYSSVAIVKNTTQNGVTSTWTADNNGFVYRNGEMQKSTIAYGASMPHAGLLNYNNDTLLKTSRSGYYVADGAEWKCISGDCKGDIFDQDVSYKASDFCDASDGDCEVILGINWKQNASSGTGSGTDKDGNVTENVQTGDIAIAITWFVGIFAIAYSIFYFGKVREN